MNYYIDFDNTLYETAKLTTYMLKAICDTVVEKRGIAYEEIDSYVKENFNSTKDNIFTFAKFFAIIILYNYAQEVNYGI
jgi:hypothetical protein